MSHAIQLKSCPRCNGDLMIEEYLGDSDLVCLQCGHRTPTTGTNPTYALAKMRAQRGDGRKAA